MSLFRRGRANEHSSLIEQLLPVDLLMRMLGFVNIPDQLQLAACSTMLEKLLFEDCTSLWETIDLSFHASWEQQGNLTDSVLANLLVKVNARNLTKSLDIRGCRNIEGRGLKPLRFSRVLEQVRFGCLAEFHPLDEHAIVGVLRTISRTISFTSRSNPLETLLSLSSSYMIFVLESTSEPLSTIFRALAANA